MLNINPKNSVLCLTLNDRIIFLHGAFGVLILLANRSKLRLQIGFESEATARERTEKENVCIKAVSIFLVRMERN